MKSSLMPPLTARARLQPGDLHSAQRKAPSGCSSAVFLLAPGALADWKSILVQSIPWPVCTGKTFELKRLARLHKDPTGFPSKAASGSVCASRAYECWWKDWLQELWGCFHYDIPLYVGPINMEHIQTYTRVCP